METAQDSLIGEIDVIRCQLCITKDRKCEAKHVCKTCLVNLCPDCVDLHKIDSGFSHNVVTLNFYHFENYSSQCVVHQNLKCDRFCTNCNHQICTGCVTSGCHRNHKIKNKINPLLRAHEGHTKDTELLHGRDIHEPYITEDISGNNLSRRLLSILVISLLFSIILHVPVCFYAYHSYPYFGEFRLEETPLDLNPECQSCFKSYRGATLNGYFKTENIFRIGVKYENVWNDNSNIENIVMFQIGLVGKEGLDIDNDFGLLDGLFVSMKYYKGYKCLVVENGTTVLFRHKVSYLSEKLCYHDILSFERKNGNLYVHYDIQNTTHIPLVFVAFKDLTSYSFIAGLGYPSFTLVAMTLHGTTLTSKFHKDMYISSKGKVLSNYNIGLEYKSSFADTPIHKTTEFGQSILQVKAKIFFKPNSYYGDKEEKDLFELGLAPMNLISRNMPLRNAKDTVLIQVRLEWRTSSIRKLHLYTWENGSIRQHRELPHNILQKDKSIMLHFKFNINSEAKRIELSTDNYSYDTMNHYLYVFENFEFNNILYPFVRKETIFPIRMFYTIRKSTINPVNRKYELHPVALYIFLRSGK